ncbi:MAG: hypothetical protein ACRDRJ_30595 [Streptosporangiaceae bacterium]
MRVGRITRRRRAAGWMRRRAGAGLAAAGLAGLEVNHPDHDQAQRDHLTALAASLDLAVTGGSDDHGELTGYRIGCDTTGAGELARLVAAATGAAPVTGS